MSVISIHQPETLPYPGYFSKMMNSDVFVIMDNVQYKKNNYQNRNRILHLGNAKWLTLPIVAEGRLSSTIADTKIANTIDWKARTIKVLEDAYKNSKYFSVHMPRLIEIINNSDDSLLHFNMAIINYIRECLSINTPLVYLSELGIDSHKSDLVFDICKSMNATIYLSGAGGKTYLELDKFKESNITVVYQEFDESIRYYQDSGDNGFVPYMSTIDILMNNSNEDSRFYIDQAFSYKS